MHRTVPFTYEQLIDRINGELVNILGNLVNRTIAMSKKYFDSIVSNPKAKEDIDNELIELTEKTPFGRGKDERIKSCGCDKSDYSSCEKK